MKNKISFKKFNIIFILLVFIVILSSMYYQYNAFNKIIIKNFENENYNKSFAIREKFRLIFDKLQYNFIKSENDNLKKLDELYEIYKNEKHDLNLTKIEKELNKNVAFGKYQVFLINKDYIIENASYKKEIGFDLGQFKIIRELFDNLYAKKIKIDISSPKLDEESRLKRYLIKLSDDEKYILQLGFYLDNNEIKKQLSYLITDAIKINLYLASEFFIQEINFKDQKLKNTSHFNKSAKTTKELLTELNLVLKNEEIEKLLQKDSKKEDISLNRSLEKLLPLNKGLVSYINKEENRISFFSSTGSTFGEYSEVILFIKTSFSLDPLNKNINVNQNNFLFVFMLVFLVLTVFEYIRRKEISLKIISITSKIQNHKLIENESSIIKEISFLITSYNDMLKKLNAQIKTNKEISYIDTLTQIKNRKAYNEKIEESVSLYKRYKNSFSIALLDIDDFKKINDTYGHSAGDIVLQDIAKLLVSTTRSNDMIFRIGGEEFIIIFPNTALDDSKNAAEEIRKKIKNSLTVTNNDTITVSIGITEINDNDSVDSLFQRIDTFLYDSKKHGKDQIISG